MEIKINKLVAKQVGLEEGLVYQYLVDNMNHNQEVVASYIQLATEIDLLSINDVKNAVLNLMETGIVNVSFDFDNNMFIKVEEVIAE